MNNESSTQIGAKALTKAEINLILPSYDRILSQIEEIRKESDLSKDTQIQKTNNISILGVRGSGKTSILKSIINDLENRNKKEEINIIFPMIIPENMSEKMNLLSTILGLFKKKVDEIENKNKEKSQNCWEKTTTEVSKKYNSLLKKYCHMQSEFRQVSIDEFISESNYVRKNAEIFNADSEFIIAFNEFIDELTKSSGTNTSNNSMIFFFIDDIDLSTNRCTDIIKTLLAYMSHPKIVTILSGDLDTFAEELTIDFLKKGDLLHKELLDISFINNGNENILERKKELAYEYLKKIIPPIYRHNLKTWSLKNRAQFKSATTIDGGKESDNKPLVELLADTFRDYDCEALFQYYDFNEEDENKRIKPIPQMFNMFDDTSRGLNNVYNALLQVNKYIKDDNNKEYNDYDTKCFQYIRNFLETVISSNKILNSYTGFLNSVISMGSSFEDTIIDCEYFYNNVYFKEKITVKILEDKEKKDIPTFIELDEYLSHLTFQYNDSHSIDILVNEKENFIDENKALKRFTLFTFFDLAIRILKKNEILKYTNYQKNIRGVAIDLIKYQILSSKKCIYNLPFYKWNLYKILNTEFVLLIHFFNIIITESYSDKELFKIFFLYIHDDYDNIENQNIDDFENLINSCEYIGHDFKIKRQRNYVYSLTLISYSKISIKRQNDIIKKLLSERSNINARLLNIILYENSYNEYRNIYFYFYEINNSGKLFDKLSLVDGNCKHIEKIDLFIQIFCNFIFEEIKTFENKNIVEISNKYLRDNSDDKTIKCILEIDKKNCWDLTRILPVKNLIFKNITDKMLSSINKNTMVKIDVSKDFDNEKKITTNEITLTIYFKLFRDNYLNLLPEQYSYNSIKILKNAIVKIDDNDELKFWIYAHLRSVMNHSNYNTHADKCISNFIDELYAYFAENDFFDKSEIENKLTLETIKTIERIERLSNIKDDSVKKVSAPLKSIT